MAAMPAPNYCPKCGHKPPDDARFCPTCGQLMVGGVDQPVVETSTAVAVPRSESPGAERGVRGWLDRRKAQHEEQLAEDERFQAAVAKLRDGDDSAETLAELASLVDPRHARDSCAALIAFSEALLKDDRITLDDEAAWARVSDALGVKPADLATNQFAGILTQLAIGRINDGRLPVVPPGGSRLLVKPGEIVHVEKTASLMKEVIDREFQGGSSGISIPLGKGVRYRTGSFRGKSVVVGSHLEAADTGILSVSSRRVVFMGNRKTIDTPYTKLAGLDVYTDGLRVHCSSRQTASLFTMAKGAEVVAATIQAAVHRAEDIT
jgi:hypothetical protein